MDKIIIKNLTLFAYHGVNDFEKEKGQIFELDITCSLNLDIPCLTDDLNDTVSYAKIIKTAKKVFPAQKDDLIERAARRTVDAIMQDYPQIRSTTLLLRKPHAPIQADFDYVAVEITVNR